jgi:hypothetical protein
MIDLDLSSEYMYRPDLQYSYTLYIHVHNVHTLLTWTHGLKIRGFASCCQGQGWGTTQSHFRRKQDIFTADMSPSMLYLTVLMHLTFSLLSRSIPSTVRGVCGCMSLGVTAKLAVHFGL